MSLLDDESFHQKTEKKALNMKHCSPKRTSRCSTARAGSASCTDLPRPSIFILKAREGIIGENCVRFATHVAVPSKDYVAYLQRLSRRKNATSIQSRWTMNVHKRFYFRQNEEYDLFLVRQPSGWIIERDHYDDAPCETLSTILDGIPVVFPTLKLAALIAKSPDLVALAKLYWRSETQPMSEARCDDAQTATV